MEISADGTIEVDEACDLVAHLGEGDFELQHPNVYQDIGGVRRSIDAAYLVESATAGA
jgi:hypothetical protein